MDFIRRLNNFELKIEIPRLAKHKNNWVNIETNDSE